MTRRLFLIYTFSSIVFLLLAVIFVLFQVIRLGLISGLLVSFLTWATYVLCVPAAHGRVIVGGPIFLLTRKRIKPERFVWAFALVTHVVALILQPHLYLLSAPMFLFLRITKTPHYWVILVLGMLGAWYRVALSDDLTPVQERRHAVVRHLLLIVGLFLILFLLHKELIIYLNATSTG